MKGDHSLPVEPYRRAVVGLHVVLTGVLAGLAAYVAIARNALVALLYVACVGVQAAAAMASTRSDAYYRRRYGFPELPDFGDNAPHA